MKIQPLLERLADTVRAYVDRRVGDVENIVKAMPTPKDGRDGVDGKDGRDGLTPTPEQVKAIVEPLIEPIIRPLIPAPVSGEKGVDGKDGRDGIDGKDGRTPTVEEIKALIPEPMAGEKGERGDAGSPGEKGDPGRDGVDGKSVTLEEVLPLLDGYLAKWALAAEQRVGDVIQRGIDRIEKPKDGKDGKDGRDAFDLEHLFVSLGEDERTLTFGFVRGDERVERSVKLHHQLYRGVWKSGAYERGDTVTFAGGQFVATRDTTSKPETDDSWRLTVKRGRDGKDGRDLSPPPHRVVQA